MSTKTRECYAMHRTVQDRMDAELQVVARAEFPIGSKVRWIRTFSRDGVPKYLEGKVLRHSDFGWAVQRGTATWHKDPWELEPAQ